MPGALTTVAAWVGIDQWVGGWSGLAASTALTLLIASLSWYLFENPINSLKRHFDEPAGGGVTPSARP